MIARARAHVPHIDVGDSFDGTVGQTLTLTHTLTRPWSNFVDVARGPARHIGQQIVFFERRRRCHFASPQLLGVHVVSTEKSN